MIDRNAREKTARLAPKFGASQSFDKPAKFHVSSGRMSGTGLKAKICLGIVATILTIQPFSPGAAQAATARNAFLVPLSTTTSPPGAVSLCTQYRWACVRTQTTRISNKAVLQSARTINRRVNRRIRQIEDQVQYRTEEYWALPTRRGGDCEDLALLKMKLLLEAGVSSENLMIATVLDTRRRSHAVLVLRTAGGDVVLDNLRNRILPWSRTGYTFLKMQNPTSPGGWDAILAGGIMPDRSTASSAGR